MYFGNLEIGRQLATLVERTGHNNCGSIRASRASAWASMRSSFFRLSPIKRTLGGMRHNHFVPQLAQRPAHPGRVHPRLQCDPAARHCAEHFLHGFRSRVRFSSSSMSPTPSSRQDQLDRSPRSNPMISFCAGTFPRRDGSRPVIEDSRPPACCCRQASLIPGSEPLPFAISQGIFQINSDCFRPAPWTFPGTGNKITPS
jgi:hypothetical protein